MSTKQAIEQCRAFGQLSLFLLSCLKVHSFFFTLFSTEMESAFDNLDAAGFLEIWQHFDADGENS